MPKLTDRAALSEKVLPVVCRIVVDEGVAAASVRRVADEAGITPSALRVQWPSQEALHTKAALWAASHLGDDWPWWEDGKDIAVHLQQMVTVLLPSDDQQIMYAQACRAFAASGLAASGNKTGGKNGDVRRVIRMHCNGEVSIVGHAIRQLRGLLGVKMPGRVILAADWRPTVADDLDATELHLLLIVVGLTELMTRPDDPLSREAAARWVSRLTLAHLDLPA